MIRLTKHVQEAAGARNIALAWIEATVTLPDYVAPDPRHPDRTRSYKAIAEQDGRTLRVVHRFEGDDIVIITAHFDRGTRR